MLSTDSTKTPKVSFRTSNKNKRLLVIKYWVCEEKTCYSERRFSQIYRDHTQSYALILTLRISNRFFSIHGIKDIQLGVVRVIAVLCGKSSMIY